MKKGKIFTNCLFSFWTLSIVLSFASCSADGDSTSVIDDRVPLETEVPFYVILKAYSNNSDITANGDVKNTTLYVFDGNKTCVMVLGIIYNQYHAGRNTIINNFI